MLLRIMLSLLLALVVVNSYVSSKKMRPVGSLYAESDKNSLPKNVRFCSKTANSNGNRSLSPSLARSCLKRLSTAEVNYKQYLAEARCTRQLLLTFNDYILSSSVSSVDGFQVLLEIEPLARARFKRLSQETLTGALPAKRNGVCELLNILQLSLSNGHMSNLDPPVVPEGNDSLSHFVLSLSDSIALQLAGLLLVFILLRCCAHHLWSPLTVAGIIMGCFVISICLNCLRQYHERKAEADAAMIHLMQEPCQVLPGLNRVSEGEKKQLREPSYIRSIGSSILPSLISPFPTSFSEPATCAHHRKKAQTHPILQVDPWEAVVTAFSKTMLTPVRLLFDHVANAVSEHGWIVGSGCIFLVAAVIWLLRPSLLNTSGFMPQMPDPTAAFRSRRRLPSSDDATPTPHRRIANNTSTTPNGNGSFGPSLPLPALASPSPDRRRDLKKLRHKGQLSHLPIVLTRHSDRRRSL